MKTCFKLSAAPGLAPLRRTITAGEFAAIRAKAIDQTKAADLLTHRFQPLASADYAGVQTDTFGPCSAAWQVDEDGKALACKIAD